MTHEQFHVFTIFKCDYNVGITNIIVLFDVLTYFTCFTYFTYLTYLCAYISLVEMMFFCKHCKKYWNFTQSSGVEILRKRTVSADPWVIHPKICGNCPPTENLLTRKLEEIPALYAVEATFVIIHLCLLFSAGFNFLIKYVSHDYLKILLSSWIAKNSIIFELPPAHVLIWPSTSICCNSGSRICHL